MDDVELEKLRDQLVGAGLSDVVTTGPVALIETWIETARGAGLFNHDAMAVASVDSDGRPSVRNVLMRGVIDGGLCFYTNYRSQKGLELAAQPGVEALFSWLVLERQIRVRGTATQLSTEQSDAYFASRPRGSQIAAHASPQSEVIPSRAWLDDRYTDLAAQFEGRPVERPPHWGGFRIEPERVEFWQGQPNRLHHRLAFERSGDGWSSSQLAP